MTCKYHLFHKKRLPSAYNLLLCFSIFIGMGTLHASTSGLFFREGTRDTPPALPISQDHVANPQLQIKLYGAATKQLKKSYHENKRLDPHYLWSGRCEDRWAVTWRKSDAKANLTGSEARVRLRTSNSRRTLYIILRTDDGWLISDQGAEPSGRNWKRTTLKFEGLTWNRMKPSLVRGEDVEDPDLSRVKEIGVTDLKKGEGSSASSRLDWIEVWEHLPENKVYAVRAADGYQVYQGNRPVLFYHTEENTWKGKYGRSNYIHPLRNPERKILTQDFPDDHRHHRGIFWAWHQVLVNGKQVGDAWSCEDVSWKVHDVKILHPDQSSMALQAQVDWRSPTWKDGKKPFMAESVRIHVHPADGQQQKVDFSIELVAETNNVKIGGADNKKGYGGFSLRFLMPEDIKFKSKNRTVEAKRTAVDQSPWMNFSGSFGRNRSNITVLTHPETSGFPQPWILRRRGSMQNPVFPGREPVTVPTDKALTLKYRIVLHESGNPSTLFEQYRD